MKILAFDPGGTTGYCILNSEEHMPIEDYGEFSVPGLYRWLWNQNLEGIDLVIIEDYTVDPKIDHRHSRVPTIQVIGAIQCMALNCGVKTYLQNRSIKTVGYGWMGMENKHKHWQDALIHGMYYLIKNKYIKRRTFGSVKQSLPTLPTMLVRKVR